MNNYYNSSQVMANCSWSHSSRPIYVAPVLKQNTWNLKQIYTAPIICLRISQLGPLSSENECEVALQKNGRSREYFVCYSLLLLVSAKIVSGRRHRADNGSASHGSWVKWVDKCKWVTLVTGQYCKTLNPWLGEV